MTQSDLEGQGYRFSVMHGQGVTVQIVAGKAYAEGAIVSRVFVANVTTSNRHDSMQLAVKKAMLHFVESRLS